MAASQLLLCNNGCLATKRFCTKPIVCHNRQFYKSKETKIFNSKSLLLPERLISRKVTVCHAARRNSTGSDAAVSSEGGNGDTVRKALQVILWACEGVYILWLFLLPYAPGDPVWAISKETIDSLIGLSLNFFFILPLLNSGAELRQPTLDQPSSKKVLAIVVVGIHLLEAPVLHPASEGLFNFVIGWTFMFAPLLFTDRKRDRYKGSLDILWGLQMFLTNTFLIPYMAIRLNDADSESSTPKRSQLGTVMTNGAPIVGLIGGLACVVSAVWALYGRMDGDFGGIADRWDFLISYLGSERLAYAFIWDIAFYTVFQPWLIGDNLQNMQQSKVDLLKYLRFVPVVGLMAYLLCLNLEQ